MTDKPCQDQGPADGTQGDANGEFRHGAGAGPADPEATLDAASSRPVIHPDEDRTLLPPPVPSDSATLNLDPNAPAGGLRDPGHGLPEKTQVLPSSGPAVGDATLGFVPERTPPADATQNSTAGASPATPAGDGTAVFTGPAAGTGTITSAGQAPPGPPAGPSTGGSASGAGAAGGNRYTPNRVFARGGMGEVWVTQDRAIGRTVALKRMLGQPRPDQQVRFLFEAKVTGQLEHPGIVPVHEVGHDEAGRPYYVMKFVQGRTLKAVIKEHHEAGHQPGAPREVERLRLLESFVNLCRTVAYAHSRGVLHRDLKPENVMLGSYGETVVLDWGLAKIVGAPELPPGPDGAGVVSGSVQADTTETMDGAIMGSPFYMAPEAAAGLASRMDQRSDVYLLGATLYEILTGRPPREGKNVVELVRQARKVAPPAPRALRPEVPRPLDAICRKAMEMHPGDRYPDALALAEDVQRYVAGEPVSAYREGPLERAWRWARRHRRALAWAAGTLALLAAGLVVADQLHKAELRRAAAEQKQAAAEFQARGLQAREEAQRQVIDFRRRADEARFLAANTNPLTAPRLPANGPTLLARTVAADTNPVKGRAPYFDPGEARAAARAALAVADPWGPGLAELPLAEERPRVARELYDLLLAAAQAAPPDGAGGRETLALLDRAAPLREATTRGYHRLRAEALARTGDDAGAKAEREKAAGTGTPEAAMDLFLAGEALRIGTGDLVYDTAARREALEKAVECYRGALAADPGHFWSQYQLGRCYLGLGRDAEAVEALGACIALKPDSPWGHASRGFALGQLKRYAEAEADLGRALALDPGLRPVRLNRGWVSLQQKKLDEALDDFDAVLAPPEEMRLAEAVYYRALARLEQGLGKEALQELEPVAIDRPSLRPVAQLRAQLRLRQGDVPGALEDLSAYVGVGPGLAGDSAEACERRGRELRLMDCRDLPPPARRAAREAAGEQFERAVARGADSAELYRDYGVVLEKLGKTAPAVQAYTRGLDREPDHVRLLVLRGWAQEQLRQYDQARDDFARAVDKAPADAEAHTGLGYLQARRKDFGAARREANLALLHGAGDYLILHNVACIYAEMARHDRVGAEDHENAALDLLRQAVALWRKGGRGPDEVQLILKEPAFPDSLRARPEFQELVKDAPGGV